jgi:hypothetical protein
MRALGRTAASPGRVFLTGGATAVLLGWRESTIDVDIKLVPDQDAVRVDAVAAPPECTALWSDVCD